MQIDIFSHSHSFGISVLRSWASSEIADKHIVYNERRHQNRNTSTALNDRGLLYVIHNVDF